MTQLACDSCPPAVAQTASATSSQTASRGADDWVENLSIAMHDLRNVLTIVQYTVDVWRYGAAAGGRQTEDWAAVRSASGRAVRLAHELADLCEAAHCGQRLDRRRLDLVALVADAADAWRAAFGRVGICLLVDLPGEPVWIDADGDRLTRVLDNLLDNAAKYAGPASHVTVSVDCGRGGAVVRVLDNGVGISPDFVSRVFDPFTRDENPVVRSRPGSGIGLYAVRRSVELHGGSVHVASAGRGRGSEFTIRLPVSTAVPITAPSGVTNASSKRINSTGAA
jgi:signal transduction histidine kinase